MQYQYDDTFDREALERMLGLDVPVYVQYGRWLGDILLRGTFGVSMVGVIPIEERILARLPVTIELGVMAIVIGLVIALPVGIYSAIRQDTAADYTGRAAAIIGLATPNFWLALMVMIYPSIWWGWVPPMRWVPFAEDPLGNLALFIIPSLILGTAGAAGTMRLMRTTMLEVLRQDYVRTAWAKGLKERAVIVRHALKNAFIPVVTLIGLQLPLLVGGSVIIENIFNLMPIVIITFSVSIGGVVLALASLGFLGYGLPPGIPDWGGLLSREGRQYMEIAPRLAFWPGLCLTITVFSLNMFGDAVRDLLDPRLRGAGS